MMNAPPEGLLYVPDFLSPEEQAGLLQELHSLSFEHDFFRGQRLRRGYAQFGYSPTSPRAESWKRLRRCRISSLAVIEKLHIPSVPENRSSTSASLHNTPQTPELVGTPMHPDLEIL